MSQSIPSYSSVTLPGRRVLASHIGLEQGPDVVVQNDQTDSGSTPTHRLRPGQVYAKRTSSGEYVKANDANADKSSAPVLTSAEVPDGDWASKVITMKRGGQTVVAVTLGGGDDTTAEVVTALQANAIFAANFKAAGTNGNALTITGLRVGAGEQISVTMDLDTAWASDDGATSSDDAAGADADILVGADFADTKDEQGTAQNPLVATYRRGHFYAADLINLTDDARAVLARRGSRFE